MLRDIVQSPASLEAWHGHAARPEVVTLDHHVRGYEAVFEPMTCTFAAAAIERVLVAPNERVIDVATAP